MYHASHYSLQNHFWVRTWDYWLKLANLHAFSRLDKYMACMLNAEKKKKIIKKYQVHKDDTGSTEVQLAILSAEIDELIEHLKLHAKDHSSRRGLLRKVGERRKFLRFLKKENPASYEDLVKKLKLKQAKALMKPGEVEVDEVDNFEDNEPAEEAK